MKKIKNYQTIPKPIQAIQFKNDDNKYYVLELMKGTPFNANFEHNKEGKLVRMVITTEHLHIPLDIGSWLIKDDEGDISYTDNDGFKKLFVEIKTKELTLTQRFGNSN